MTRARENPKITHEGAAPDTGTVCKDATTRLHENKNCSVALKAFRKGHARGTRERETCPHEHVGNQAGYVITCPVFLFEI